jgi:hypothetical protein
MMQMSGLEDHATNIRFVALLTILSNEENLCIRLLERGIQTVLISMQEISGSSLASLAGTGAATAKLRNATQQAGTMEGAATTTQSANPNAPFNNTKSFKLAGPLSQKGVNPTADGEATSASTKGVDVQLFGTLEDGINLARGMAAAALHNIALKRAVMGPGVLTSLLSFMRNCKSIRVLHCVRCLANVSVHAKAKLALAKERRLIPILTNTMRYGCEEVCM